jgi:phage terminase Nu1 subunit (DNA packaging protein)
MLRGVSTAYRANFVADKPALQLALLALDDAANPYIEGLDEDERADVEEWLERRRQRVAPGGLAEALFEATNFAERNMVALLFDAHDCINARSEVGA